MIDYFFRYVEIKQLKSIDSKHLISTLTSIFSLPFRTLKISKRTFSFDELIVYLFLKKTSKIFLVMYNFKKSSSGLC